MQPMLIEISNYISSVDLEARTKFRYKKHLLAFAEYLSDTTKKPLSEVHLSKIFYLPYDENSGMYLPINSEIVDKYMFANLSRNYSWLSTTTSALQSFFRYLSTKYDIRNIMRDIDFKLKDHYVEPKHKRIFNRQEILKFIWSILKFCPSDTLLRDALLFITLFTTGCRVNEILILTPADLMVDDYTFLVRKTKNKRQIYIATKIGITNCLKTYCNLNSIGNQELIFQHNGKPMTDGLVTQLLNYYSEQASLPKTRVHDTRGSFVTIMYENGSDLAVIQQMVNHICMSSTQVYLADNAVRNNDIKIPVIEAICKDLKTIIGVR